MIGPCDPPVPATLLAIRIHISDLHGGAAAALPRPMKSALAHFRYAAPSFLRASQAAARCVACHGVRSHPVPVALVGECSIPVV